MKNIHLVPTEKPSILVRIYSDVERSNFNLKLNTEVNDSFKEYVNIYITNSEEIKEGDWAFAKNYKGCKKIILTTDQDLIANGVQEIDNEFLEWFVKNPSCESVEVKSLLSDNGNIFYGYKIIIPQEEPKQETLEEAAEKYAEGKSGNSTFRNTHIRDFIEGAKWQQERSYSEKAVLKLLEEYEYDLTLADNLFEGTPKQWFEQFKKR
jgi:hypothetical protein